MPRRADWLDAGGLLRDKFKRKQGTAAVPAKSRRRDHDVAIYLTRDELDTLARAARADEVSLSEWCRKAIRAALGMGRDDKNIRHRKPRSDQRLRITPRAGSATK